MVISDDARRVQVEVFKILAASHILGIAVVDKRDPHTYQAAITAALVRAGNESAMAAAYFDQRFPSGPTIDVPSKVIEEGNKNA